MRLSLGRIGPDWILSGRRQGGGEEGLCRVHRRVERRRRLVRRLRHFRTLLGGRRRFRQLLRRVDVLVFEIRLADVAAVVLLAEAADSVVAEEDAHFAQGQSEEIGELLLLESRRSLVLLKQS